VLVGVLEVIETLSFARGAGFFLKKRRRRKGGEEEKERDTHLVKT
jgi:hypothetical protein